MNSSYQLSKKRDVIITPFESTDPTLHSRRLVQFTLQGIWTKTTVTATAFESAHTYSPDPTIPHDLGALHCTRNLRLAEPYDDFPDPPIEVLIGCDHYWKLFKDNPHCAFLLHWSYCVLFSDGFSVAIDQEF